MVRFPLAPLFRSEVGGSVLLLGATIAALVWANSPWDWAYQRVLETTLRLGPQGIAVSRSLHFWINEGLMAIFFLSVGLEIRREFLEGDLRSIKMASLPLAAALGGVLVPALIYLACNSDPLGRRGWAIPTATDIAFALAVFSFLGRRAPGSLRSLLLAIAVIDDIVAVLVIAFFYADPIEIRGLGVAAAGIAAGLLCRSILSRWVVLYALPGIGIWIGLLHAGVHPALTGVILALMLPGAPAHRLERAISLWVVLGIMPLFALANSGVTIQALTMDPAVAGRLVTGIVMALLVGKPAGIILAAAVCIRLGWCELPPELDLRRFAVVGLLGGIGFTMSLFVCGLAFEHQYLATAKLAVLLGSTLAAIAGVVIGRSILSSRGPA